MLTFRRVTLLLLLGSSLFAQTASLTGRITDTQGGVIPGARITITAASSGAKNTVETKADGYYVISALVPGAYTVEVSKAGMQTLRETGLELAVQQVGRLDLSLQVGAVSETIEVKAESVMLESETATVGQVIQSKQITNLPLLGRNTYALAMLVPGVRASAGTNQLVVDVISTSSYVINGQRANANEFLLDGAPNSAPSQNQPVINANPDMVQEFKVETNDYSSEFGRAAGGVFNVITRSGSNEYHARLYEFFRNDKLNANDFFANQAGRARPPFKFNQFGGTLGGPVTIPKLYNGKNRTFFFVSVELVRFIQGITFSGTVPQPAQLTGDFSGLRSGANLVTIYDPLTTVPNGTGGFVRSPFPGNIIPPNRINPVAARLASYIPAPNVTGSGSSNNYGRTDGNLVDKDTASYRVDHYFNEKNRFFTRYSVDDSPYTRAAPYGTANAASPVFGTQAFGRRNVVLEDTHTFSPSLLGTVRYSYSRLLIQRPAFSSGFDLTTLGFPASLANAVDPKGFPNILITGFAVSSSISNVISGAALGGNDIIRLGNDTHSVQANLNKSLSRHNLKFGGEFRGIRLNARQGGVSPAFSFTPAFTQGPNPTVSSATAGSALASFLLGFPATGSATPIPAVATQNINYGFFIQDNWKVTNRLTINAGLRYEFESPRTERFNQLSNFDYSAVPPISAAGLNLHGVVTFVNMNGLPRYNANPDRNNFAPRLGIAWTVTPKTVVRAGAGLFYASITGIGTGSDVFGIAGFNASTAMVTSLDGVTPLNGLSNPFPNGLNVPTGTTLGPATALGQSIQFTDRGNVTPYSAQWNLNIQRELPGSFLAEVGYLGSRGLHLLQAIQFNQLPDSALALGDALRQQVANPFFGKINSGILSTPTVSRAQLLRPYPQFDGVQSNNATWASSSYNALTAKLERRFSKGFTALVSYTYSKLMDDSIGAFAGEDLGAGGFQNYNNLAAEWSPSLTDQTHRFIANAVYEIPFAKQQKGFMGKVAGGWQISGILSLFSGGPIGVSSAVNNTFSQGGGQRPNWTGVNPALPNPTPTKWIDASQFSVPAPYTFGNAPRTFDGLRTDRTRQLDVSMVKNTTIRERLQLQFRAESFNLTNTPRFGPPNSSFGNAQFGVISSMGNQPRVLQFALKLIF